MKIVILVILIVVLYLFINHHNLKNGIEEFTNSNNQNNSNNSNNFKIEKIYFINLERHKDRREYMEDQFRKNNLNIERYNAFDKNDIDDLYLDNMIRNNLLETKEPIKIKNKYGSLACLISHTELWRKILNDNIKEKENNFYLIFEDDCKILPKFNEKLKFYIKHIPNDADMVWLGYNRVKGEKVNDYFYRPENKFNWKYNSQHHCYIVNKRGIEKVLNFLFPVKKDFMTKDSTIKLNFDKFNAYFLHEKLSIQDLEEFPKSERTGQTNG